MESAEGDNQDIQREEGQDPSAEKRSRFNLRKLNIPPLKRDHSRSMDISQMLSGANNKPLRSNLSDAQLKFHDLPKAFANPSSPSNMTPSRSRRTSNVFDVESFQQGNAPEGSNQPQLSVQDQRRERRKRLNLRENLSPQQLVNSGEYGHQQQPESDSKTTGRWSREEHEKFIEAMSMYGRDWKRVEQHIGTRSGAQIRSHAQKFFNRIEKELGQDVDTYIKNKAQSLFGRVPPFKNDESHDVQMRKGSLLLGDQYQQIPRDRSISHTFGLHFDPMNNFKQDLDAIREDPSKDIGKQSCSKNKINNNFSFQNKSTFGSQQPPLETPLQRVLKESINNYTSPQKEEQEDGLENKLEEYLKERSQISQNLIQNYQEAINNPITIQTYIDQYKELLQQIQQTYFSNLKDPHSPVTPTQKETVLSLFIEIQSNLQLLQQIQMFVGMSLQHQNEAISNNISPESQVKSKQNPSLHSPSQHPVPLNLHQNNDNSQDKHQSSAETITKLLQQYQGAQKRKLSDFVDLGSHDRNTSHNDDSLRKRDVKYQEKVQENTFKPVTILPNSAFQGIGAQSTFHPVNKSSFSIESLKRLRGASTSNESGIVGQEKANSPGKVKEAVGEQLKATDEGVQTEKDMVSTPIKEENVEGQE